MAMIRVYVDTGYPTASHEDYEELPDDWEEMTEEEQQKYLEELAVDYMNNRIECGAYVVEKKGDQ